MAETNDFKINTESTNIASKTVGRKLEANEWLNIETVGTKLDQIIYDSLIEFSRNITTGTSDIDYSKNIKPHDVLGEDLYTKIRFKFSNLDLVKKKTFSKNVFDEKDKKIRNKKSKLKVKKTMTGDEIRIKSTIDKIDDLTKNITESYSMKKFTPQYGLKQDVIEFIGMTYIYMIRFCLVHQSYFQKEKNYPQILNLLVSSQRLLDSIKNYQGNDMITPLKLEKISKTFVNDLDEAYNDLSKVFKFDGIEVYNKCPKLLVWSDLDKYIPQGKIEPRKHQKDIMIESFKNFNKGFLTIYNAMIGSGKTTTVIGLAKIVEHFRNTNEDYEDLELLFVCNLDSVRKQVGNILYNTILMSEEKGIKFGIATTEKDGKDIKVSNHFSCKKDSERIVLITNPETAIKLINQNKKTKYVLFHDEPTIGADIDNSDSLRSNIQVLINLPKWTIFSSATAPEISDLGHITKKAKENYPDIIINKIYSPQIQIGIDVRTFDLNLVSPFSGCNSKNDLITIIDTVKEIPFLGRMFNSNIALTLWNECKDYKFSKPFPNIPELFKNVVNMKADKIRLIVIEMLSLISELNDDEIKSICSKKLMDYNTKDVHNEIDFKNLGTTESHKFDNMTLIATTNPYQFTKNNFKSLIDYLKKDKSDERKEDKITNFDKIYDKFLNDMSLYENIISKLEGSSIKDFEKTFRKFEKDFVKLNIDIKLECRMSEKTDDKEKSIEEKQRILRIIYRSQPRLNFPAYAQINTIEHEKEFNKTDIKLSHTKMNKDEININDIPFNRMKVSDEILILLLCGVGIYSPSDSRLDSTYLSTVLNLASKGLLVYIIADNSISYGTNYPISRVIITEDFSLNHSIYTLFQLMGRAGRIGKSWKATAIVSKDTSKKIVDFAINPKIYNIEVENIKKMIDRIGFEEEQKIINDLQKM